MQRRQGWRTGSPFPLVALLAVNGELLPASVQVDDHRHRVHHLFLHGKIRVLHCSRKSKARWCRRESFRPPCGEKTFETDTPTKKEGLQGRREPIGRTAARAARRTWLASLCKSCNGRMSERRSAVDSTTPQPSTRSTELASSDAVRGCDSFELAKKGASTSCHLFPARWPMLL